MCLNITENKKSNVDYASVYRISMYQMIGGWFILLTVYLVVQNQRIRFYRDSVKRMELEQNKRNEDFLYQLDLLEKNEKEKDKDKVKESHV